MYRMRWRLLAFSIMVRQLRNILLMRVAVWLQEGSVAISNYVAKKSTRLSDELEVIMQAIDLAKHRIKHQADKDA